VAVGTEIDASENVACALGGGREVTGIRGLVVVTGSIYIVGEAMRKLAIGI
jgi:hypothetical protein